MTVITFQRQPSKNQACQDANFRMRRPHIPVAEEMFDSRQLRRRDGQLAPLDVFIPRLEGDLLYSLVRHLRPKVTVEVGLANGISALFISQALRDNVAGRHIAIDPYQTSDWHDAGLTALQRAGLADLVTLYPRPSHWVLPELEAAQVRAQFVFIDGSHQFDYVMCDFLASDRILEVGGLMAFDDSDWPAVSGVIRYALANRHYEVFDTTVVIEPAPVRPSVAARFLRTLGRRIHPLGQRLRCDFLRPNHELGIRGRCVVLRKLGEDDRDSQSRTFSAF